MIGALVRVIFGFALAVLAAGLVFVLFALPPTELLSERSPGVGAALDWALKAATQAAIFAAPFALIAAAIGEWQSLRGPVFYAIAGMLIAAAGFLAQQSSETAGQLTVVNSYAMGAFFAAGLGGGLVYWLIAGRMAGDAEPEPVIVRPTASGAGANGKAVVPKPAEAKPGAVSAPKEPAMGTVTAPEAIKPAGASKPGEPGRGGIVPKPGDAGKKTPPDETSPAVSDPEAKV